MQSLLKELRALLLHLGNIGKVRQQNVIGVIPLSAQTARKNEVGFGSQKHLVKYCESKGSLTTENTMARATSISLSVQSVPVRGLLLHTRIHAASRAPRLEFKGVG